MPSIVVPALGESITEGVLSRWLVADGATVAPETPVFELETDKITTEVPAGAAGVLRQRARAGETVKVGAVVAEVETVHAAPAAAASGPAPAPPAAAAPTAPAAASSPPAARPQPGPAARQLLAETGLDPAQIVG
ncbi:MAG: dihydrolipoamide succinyltransferase, partial [Planctomycetes bacterium]|nr:dihydrolipoamide succinyltransferase [Planctomycetota bacterium]